MHDKESMTPQEQSEIWGSTWTNEYAEEAQHKWGHTPEWEQSQSRKASMSKADFAAARAATEALEHRLADAKRDGIQPGSEKANALVEEHRADLSQWFEVTPAKHVLIARGYVADPRFTAYYDAKEPGLAAWLKEAVDAAARDHGIDPESAEWD